MRDRLTTLQEHLLKLKYQPDAVAEHQGWCHTAERTREQIGDIVADSPGIFGGKPDEMVAEMYPRACREARRATGLPLSTFPAECPWTYDQVMDEDFFPGVTRAEP